MFQRYTLIIRDLRFGLFGNPHRHGLIHIFSYDIPFNISNSSAISMKRSQVPNMSERFKELLFRIWNDSFF